MAWARRGYCARAATRRPSPRGRIAGTQASLSRSALTASRSRTVSASRIVGSLTRPAAERARQHEGPAGAQQALGGGGHRHVLARVVVDEHQVVGAVGEPGQHVQGPPGDDPGPRRRVAGRGEDPPGDPLMLRLEVDRGEDAVAAHAAQQPPAAHPRAGADLDDGLGVADRGDDPQRRALAPADAGDAQLGGLLTGCGEHRILQHVAVDEVGELLRGSYGRGDVAPPGDVDPRKPRRPRPARVGCRPVNAGCETDGGADRDRRFGLASARPRRIDQPGWLADAACAAATAARPEQLVVRRPRTTRGATRTRRSSWSRPRPTEPPELEKPPPPGQGPRIGIGLVLIVSIVTALLAGALGGTLGYAFAGGGRRRRLGSSPLGSDPPLNGRPPDTVAGAGQEGPAQRGDDQHAGRLAARRSAPASSSPPTGTSSPTTTSSPAAPARPTVRFTTAPPPRRRWSAATPSPTSPCSRSTAAGLQPPVEFGDSDAVAVGDPVVAIGSPLALAEHRHRRASSAPSTGRSRPASRRHRRATTRRSRPTPRSTRATPAARCSTAPAGSSASTP